MGQVPHLYKMIFRHEEGDGPLNFDEEGRSVNNFYEEVHATATKDFTKLFDWYEKFRLEFAEARARGSY